MTMRMIATSKMVTTTIMTKMIATTPAALNPDDCDSCPSIITSAKPSSAKVPSAIPS